jgi:hypothetical protein
MFRGDVDDMARLLETVNEDNTTLSLTKIIAVPEELLNTSAPNRDEKEKERMLKLYGAADWYDFQVKNWGTKWNVEAQIIYDSNATAIGYRSHTLPDTRVVKMEFDSAWGPPSAAIAMLAKQFPKVDIHHCFDETGCDFSGYQMYSKGECIESKDYDSWTNVRSYLEPDEDFFDNFFPDNS